MVSKIRQDRRDRQKKHIPSKKAWDVNTRSWIDNPELNELTDDTKLEEEEIKEDGVTPKSD